MSYLNSPEKILDFEGIDWFERPSRSEASNDEATTRPRVLLVDDDPIFCLRVAKVAKENHVNLQTCSSVEDLFHLPPPDAYDVAVLDYCFGDLTALQVGHMLNKDIPIVLISNTDRSKIHYRDWPMEVSTFVSKTLAIPVILEAALRTVGSSLPKPEANTTTRDWHLRWLLIAVSIALLALFFTQTFTIAPTVTPDSLQEFRWDGNDLYKNSANS